MIYTITLNPAIDITVSTDFLKKDSINTSYFKSISVGGKGFNTSRALDCLGCKNIALSFHGGFFSASMQKILKNERISNYLIPIENNIRVNIKIQEEVSKKLIELNERGPDLSLSETEELINRIDNLKPDPGYVVISGSLPGNMDGSIYKRMIETLKKRNITTILDTSGEPLYKGISAIPDIIKINRLELSYISTNYLKKDPEEVLLDLIKKGVKNIMVTDGPNTAYYYDISGKYSAKPAVVSNNYATGAGDSVNAGLVYSIKNGMDIEGRIKFCIACGSANLLSAIPGKIDRETIERLMTEVEVKKERS